LSSCSRSLPVQAGRRIAFLSAFLSCGCSTTSSPSLTIDEIDKATSFANAVSIQLEPGPRSLPATSALTLGLADAIRRTLKNDPNLQMALARVQQALADADQARLLPNPILNVLVRFPEGGGRTNIEAGLSADLLSVLQIPGRTSAADNRFRAVSASAVQAAIDIVAEVQEGYADAQASDALIPLLEARHALLLRLLEFARTKLAAGEGIRTDVTTLEGQRVDLEIEMARVRQDRLEQRLHLARLVGETEGDAQWGLDPWSSPALVEPVERDWIFAALAHRPELQVVEWELAALGDDFSLAKWAALGTASAGVNVERDGAWRLGPTAAVGIPIFDFGQARRDHIRAEVLESRHELTLIGRTVVEEVRRAVAAYRYSQATLARVRNELIPLQTERRALAEQAFRLGQSDVTSTFLAEHDLRAAEAKRIELERQVAVSIARLQRAVGGPGAAQELTAGPGKVEEKK
jgi:outer membrane protein, heavy metal efflux system